MLLIRFGVVCIKEYRNEWKYICKDVDLVKVSERLSGILKPDSHSGYDGKYVVHSLYFDDLKDTCVMENDAGISGRYKYRIRYYGNDPGTLKLERKEKYNGRCCKQSCKISLDTYAKLLDNKAQEVYWEADSAVLKKFCVDIMTRLFQPKAVIDYERTAYVEPVTNIRITIDRNITAAYEMEAFLYGSYISYPIQDKGEHILEVKFDHILPTYIETIVNDNLLMQTAFSKYYLGRLKLHDIRR